MFPEQDNKDIDLIQGKVRADLLVVPYKSRGFLRLEFLSYDTDPPGCSKSPLWDSRSKGDGCEQEAHAVCCVVVTKSFVSDQEPRVSASICETAAGYQLELSQFLTQRSQRSHFTSKSDQVPPLLKILQSLPSQRKSQSSYHGHKTLNDHSHPLAQSAIAFCFRPHLLLLSLFLTLPQPYGSPYSSSDMLGTGLLWTFILAVLFVGRSFPQTYLAHLLIFFCLCSTSPSYRA